MHSSIEPRRRFSSLFQRFISWASHLPDYFHVILGTVLVMLPISPLFMPVIRRDSGVFLYLGWRMLAGEVPYRDVWDHKPPLILYLNEAGLMLGHGSRWGVWILEFIFLFIAILIGMKIFRTAFGRLPAILATYFWLFGMTILISGGNYTTEYVLPIQFACYWLFYEAERVKIHTWRYFWIGMLCGFAFFLKQNTVGIGIAIVIYLLITRTSSHQWKLLISNLLAMTSGGATVLVTAVVLFWYQKALFQFWNASFLYNFSYIAASLKERIIGVLQGPVYLSGLTLAAGTGWGLYPLLRLGRIRLPQTPNQDATRLLTIGLINLPVEIFLLAISGNRYRHYYLPLLPVFALFSSFVFWVAKDQLANLNITQKGKVYVWGFLVTFVGVTVVMAAVALVTDLNFPYRRSINYNEIIDYVQECTTDNDYVLMWGAETSFNFAAKRRSPSRFSYQYPLYMDGYTTEPMVEEFLQDINKNKPALIIDTHNSLTPMFGFKVTSPRIDSLMRIVQQHYRVSKQFGPWMMYEYIGNPN